MNLSSSNSDLYVFLNLLVSFRIMPVFLMCISSLKYAISAIADFIASTDDL